MQRKIECLAGGGFVRLVEHMGDDLSIVRAARVSYNADWRVGEDGSADERLIRYLLTNRHTSPFEAVVFTFEIKVPLFIARQWHRHRTWSYNEVSARYTELDEGFYVPEVEHITTQAEGNKQMRTKAQHPDAQQMQSYMLHSFSRSHDAYKQLLAQGCPRELARSVLPVAAYTRFFGTVNLHNLFHFLRLRMHEHAQFEVRQYANALLALVTPIVPIAADAFCESIGQRKHNAD